MMDRRALNALERRLAGVYSSAAITAAQGHRAALERLARFDAELEAGRWEHLTGADTANARRNYILRRDRAEGVSRNIAAELARSGETAARMIQNESLNMFAVSYQACVGDILRQWTGGGEARINWAMYNREQLRVLLQGGAPGVGKPPFTQIAYGNLWNEKAVRRMNMRLQNMFAEAIVSGDAAFRTLARNIRAVTGFELNRCRTIARTEGARVQNQGRALAAEQAMREHGIQTVKIWQHVPVAQSPRDNHMALDGTEADAEGYFSVGGHRARYPLDPDLPPEESINCHCTHVYRVVRPGGRFYGENSGSSAATNLTSPPESGIIDVGGEVMGSGLTREERLATFDDANERSIAEYLENQGRVAVKNPLEGVLGAGRQGDAFVDGVKTEFKTLGADANSNTIKNDVNNSIAQSGQARNFVIDARNSNISEQEAERGVFRALGISRGKVDYIEVVGKDYFFGYAPKLREN